MVRLGGQPPNWSEIFERRPDLESPGYQKTVSEMKKKEPDYELERLKTKMEKIHKERLSTRNKNRSASRRSSADQDRFNSLFRVNKSRGKNR